MKTRYLLGIGVTLIAMVLIFSNKKKHRTEESEEPVTVGTAIAAKPASADVRAAKAVSADTSAPAPKPSAPAPISENVLRQFSANLKTMSKCLGITTPQIVAEQTAPTAEALTDYLRGSIGDVIVQMDDWTQTEIVDKDSVRKRVRVDYDYADSENPTRRLSLYRINSYGMPEIMDLPVDESNPSDAYIQSMIEPGQVIFEEKASRAYFTNGEELIFSVKNGSLQNVNVIKAEHSFSCINLDQETSSCSCN